MKKIFLTNRRKQIINYTLVDDEDFEWLNKYKWYKCIGYAIRKTSRTLDKNGKQKTIRMATEIMKKYRLYDDNKFIDHINRNRLDNRKCNLRMVTQSQNNCNVNKYRNNTSGYKGVYYAPYLNKKNPWKAQLQFNCQNKGLGYYKTAEEAAKAYDKAALEYHKEFACLNFKRGKYYDAPRQNETILP